MMYDDAPPDVLYHYCSVDALKGIVENHCLWLTNLFYMNDNLEHFWLRNLATEYLGHLTDMPDPPKRYEGLKDFTFGNSRGHIYCTSFSEHPDRLSQWRAYSADGAGVAIGFRADKLLRRADLRLHRVIYDKDDQLVLIRGLVNEFDAIYDAEPKDELRKSFIKFAARIWHYAAFCKNPAFEEEGEWRMIYQPVESAHGALELSFVDPISPLCFRTRGSLLVPYFELHLDLEGSPPVIQEVRLGPKAATPEQKDAIGYLLASNGFLDVTIYQSEASYR